MADTEVLFKIDDLSDLEIAVLLSLIAREHCIVDTEPELMDDLLSELRLIIENVYGLTYSVLVCTPGTTMDDLKRAFFQRGGPRRELERATISSSTSMPAESTLSFDQRAHHGFSQSQWHLDQNDMPSVNVLIAKNFDIVPQNVQLTALDILWSKQVPTTSGPHNLADPFIFIPLVPSNPRGLAHSFNRHLLDHIFSSYHHSAENGFPNVEASSGWLSDDQAPSPIRPLLSRRPTGRSQAKSGLISQEDINLLRSLSEKVNISPEINSYIYSITVFLRMNRAVTGGVTPNSTTHIKQYARCLAPLQKVDYVFPALIEIAARQVYRHRIFIGSPRTDRSLLYGSSLRAVEMAFQNLTPEIIIDDVLEEVDAPV
ncbi:hypothetical protein AAP_02559 [Ascosphaera apis ARSEF 7405]|uniref:magnesium chelatase n=1 Tax=Ascosphaera apis ARSEF 7405 TaxID=392613 RepID=A0A162IGH7_9EURO|nr:hypothetical protein AAP_02559 [Ascosphaera apis ARSEF 7405]